MSVFALSSCGGEASSGGRTEDAGSGDSTVDTTDGDADDSIYGIVDPEIDCSADDESQVEVDSAQPDEVSLEAGKSVLSESGLVVTITSVDKAEDFSELNVNAGTTKEGEIHIRVGYTVHNPTEEKVAFEGHFLRYEANLKRYRHSGQEQCGIRGVVLRPGSTVSGLRLFTDVGEDETGAILTVSDPGSSCGKISECPEI